MCTRDVLIVPLMSAYTSNPRRSNPVTLTAASFLTPLRSSIRLPSNVRFLASPGGFPRGSAQASLHAIKRRQVGNNSGNNRGAEAIFLRLNGSSPQDEERR